MSDNTYIKFLQISAENTHYSRKYHDIELMFFKKFYDKFHAIKDNPRNLKVHPNDYLFDEMWKEYKGT